MKLSLEVEIEDSWEANYGDIGGLDTLLAVLDDALSRVGDYKGMEPAQA